MSKHGEWATPHTRGEGCPGTARRRRGAFLFIVLVIVIGAGSVYSFHLGSGVTYLDEEWYLGLARNVAALKGYTFTGEEPTAYRAPGYPLLLSVPLFLGAGAIHLRILNFAMLAFSALLLHRILRQQCSAFAAGIGIVLVLCYPVLYYAAGKLFPQTFGACLFLAVLSILTDRSATARGFVVAGLLLGLLILTIPAFVLIVPPLAVWFLVFRGRAAAGRFALAVAVAALPIAAWTARNFAVFDSFVFVSSNSGLNLLLGNSENSTWNSGVTADVSKYRREVTRRGLGEAEEDAYFKSEAVRWILSHKLQAAVLYCGKWLNYFSFTNELWVKSQNARWKNLVMLATYGPLLFLFLIRLLLVRRVRPSDFEVLLAWLYLSSALFFAIFFTRIRFRLPFDYLLIMAVAVFLDSACRRYRGKARGPSATRSALSASSAGLSH